MRALLLAALLGLQALACARSASAPPPVAPRPVRVAVPHGLLARDLSDPSHEEFSTSILGNVYEPLVEVGPDLALVPVLAESWHSPDDHTWVFTLRGEARWHDGRPLLAEDVVASIRRALRAEAWARTELGSIAEVAVAGAREVRFTTRGGSQGLALPDRLVSLLIEGGPDDGGDPLGSGRYRIVAWRPDGWTRLAAFEGHRDGVPAVPTVEFVPAVEPEARVALLREGKVDLALDVPPRALAGLQQDGWRTIAQPGQRVLFLGFDASRRHSPGVDAPRNPFRDVRVRRAVSRVLDRTALVRGPLGGAGLPTTQLPTEGQMGYEPTLPGDPGADPEEARRLLEEAGFGPGFGVELEYMPGKYLEVEAVVQALAAQLAAVGIRVRPIPRPPEEFLERIDRRQSSLWLLGWLGSDKAVDATYTSLLVTPGPSAGSVNGGAYSDPMLDSLVARARSEADPEERVRLLREATLLVARQCPVVPLYRQGNLYALRPELDFQPRLDRRLVAASLRWKPSGR